MGRATGRYAVPLLVVPVASGALVAFRPQLATTPFISWRAFVATVLVGAGGLAVLGLLWRRSRLAALWTADVVVLLLIAAVVWPVFRERTVVEAFPPVVSAPSSTALPSAVPRPSVAAIRLVAGSLHGIDHHARGEVALYRVGSGVRLRFENVDIEGTPTPSVHLVAPGRESPHGGIRLGGLKGEKGSFSYAVPARFDLSRSWSVLVWCDRYAVPIAAADLRVLR